MPSLRELPELPDELIRIIPVFGPDLRQELFISDTESDQALLTNLKQGFTAACPDLGFVQWMAHIVVCQNIFEPRTALRVVIASCIQRVESITTKKPRSDNPSKWEVVFSTMDDYGRYRHSVVVDFDVKSYLLPPLVARQLELEQKEKGQ